MMIVDDKLIIGSLDLDNQGLTAHDNLVIETDEETAVERAKEIDMYRHLSNSLRLPDHLLYMT